MVTDSAPVSAVPLGTGPALIRVSTIVGEIYKARARELGLTSQQARLLFIVAENPANMLGLGATARLRKSTMTSLVDRMEELGLLARTPDPDDRRRLVVTATDYGRETSLRFERAMRLAIGDLIRSLDGADQGQLARLLSVILEDSERLLRSE